MKGKQLLYILLHLINKLKVMYNIKLLLHWYHMWLCSIATDKVVMEKQEEIEKLTREKEGEL